jgi:hypothetical protein
MNQLAPDVRPLVVAIFCLFARRVSRQILNHTLACMVAMGTSRKLVVVCDKGIKELQSTCNSVTVVIILL